MEAGPARLPHHIISPQHIGYRAWVFFLNVVVVFLACFAPVGLFTGESAVSKFTHSLNLVFLLDNFATFFIVPEDRHTRIVSVWFALDLISSGTSLFGLLSHHHLAPYGFFLLLLRLWRIWKIIILFPKWEKDIHVNYYFVRSAKLLCIVFFDIHYGGSFFYAIAVSDPNPECTWLGLVPDVSNSSISHNYTTSIYWSMTSFTTVGFGDVHSTTTKEMVFAVVLMLVNLGVMGYVATSITNMIVQESLTRTCRDGIRAVSDLAKRCKMPAAFYKELLSDLKVNLVEHSRSRQQQETLDPSPQFIRSRSTDILFRFITAKQLYLFNQLPDDLMRQLASKMKIEYLPPGKNVISQDQQPSSIYFLLNGEVDVLSNRGAVSLINRNTSMFGEIAAICDRRQLFTVRTRTSCELLQLKQKALMKILRSDVKSSASVMTNLMLRLSREGINDQFMKNLESEIMRMIDRGKKQLPLSLRFAVFRGDDVLLEKLLKDNGLDPDESDLDGMTALQYAAQNGHEMCVDCLLENRADPNSKDSDGNTPLWLAVLNGHSKIAAKLNIKGATFSKEDAVLYTTRAAVFMHEVEKHKKICTMIKTYGPTRIAIRR